MLLRCTGQMLCGIPQFVRPSWCLAAFGLLFGAHQAAGAAPSTAPPSAAEAAPPGHSGSAGRRSIRSARPRWRLRPAGCSRSVSKYKIHLIVSANIDKGKDYTKYKIKTLINWYRAANKYLVKLNTVQFFLLPGWRGCPGAASWGPPTAAAPVGVPPGAAPCPPSPKTNKKIKREKNQSMPVTFYRQCALCIDVA